MSFDLPWFRYAVPGVALGVLLFALLARRRRVKAATAWSDGLGREARRRWLDPWVLALVAALLAVGIAGPRYGLANVETETRALNLVVAIDISRSMLAEDAVPSRLARAIRESRRLLQDVRGDRVALLAFAGRSYILTPLTLDDGAVMLQLDALEPDVASEGGTDMAPVLKQGGELLNAASEGGGRVLVLFTDGEAHDSIGDMVAAARELKAQGVTVVVVGEGGTSPTRIPLRDETGVLTEFKKDASGQDVYTQRRDDLLRLLADAAEGVLVPADLPDQAGAIWKTLATLDRDPARGRRTEDLIPRAWILALGAFGIWLIQTIRRPGAALVGLTGLALLIHPAEAQRPAAGGRHLAGRDTASAVDAFVQSARARIGTDTSWYNGGSLALGQGRFDLAEEALGAAVNSLDPNVRFQALYNLGLSALTQARADTAKRQTLESLAAERFRQALLLVPTSFAAKWNLELVSQLRPPPPASSANKPQPKGGQGRPDPAPPKGMAPTEAEQILRSVERAEQGVRADQLRRRRVAKSAAGKDW